MVTPKQGCVCQICNCGRHHCPLHSNVLTKSPNGPCLLSEYRDEFLHRPVKPVEAIVPKQTNHGSGDPLSDKTTNRVDYVPFDAKPPDSCKPPERPLPDGDVESDTTYKKDYPGTTLPPVKSFKPKENRRSAGDFKGEPTYRSEYRKWDIPEKAKHPPPKPFRSDAPFEGITTVGVDYDGKRGAPAPSMKPEDKARQSTDPIDDKTSYRTEYVKHPYQRTLPADRDQYCPNEAPFDPLTNYRNDYIHRPTKPVDAIRPPQNTIDKSQPMSDCTTNRKDYIPWDQRPPKPCGPYFKPLPDGDIDSDTTYRTNYVPHGTAPAKPILPSARKRDPGPFNPNTSYRGEFRKWDIPEKAKHPPAKGFRSDAPFDGITTVSTDFVNHGNVPPPSNFAPDQTYKPRSEPIDHGTSYKTEFVPKKVDVCPAALLDTRATSYIYRFRDPEGHKHYERISQLNLAKDTAARMEQLGATN